MLFNEMPMTLDLGYVQMEYFTKDLNKYMVFFRQFAVNEQV